MKNQRVTSKVGALAALAALALGLLSPGLSAQADTAPPTSGTPVTVSSDVLPTAQMNGVAWKQIVVGNTVFVGGQFTKARPAGAPAGTQEVDRSNFLAYNLTTGALLPFAPAFNGQVRALAVSPDQRTLYVGGQFTKAAGVDRYRVAAFDIATGKLTGFTAGTNAMVYNIAASGSTVYLVGYFTSVGKSVRNNAAAVSASTGAVLPFAVTPAGGSIQHVVASPDGTKIALAGAFTTLNGSGNPGYGMALVDAKTGALLPLQANSVIRNAGQYSAITSLAPAADGFYGSGYRYGGTQAALEGSFKASWNGTLMWIGDCHGDTYSVAPAASDVYVAGHAHDCSPIRGFPDTKDPVDYYRGNAFTTAKTGTVTGFTTGYRDYRGQPAPTLLNWFPDMNAGTFTGQSQGPWSVAIGGNYVVYGGEFTKVNGQPQQGLVRYARPSLAPNRDGPRDTGTALGLTVSTATAGSATATWRSTWDRDNTRLTYKVLRNGVSVGQVVKDSTFWTRPTLSYVDRTTVAGRTYRYQVTATDPFGNSTTSAAISVRAR